MKKLLLNFTLLGISMHCYSQIHKVFRDEKGASVLISDFKGVKFFNYYYSVPLTDFKEKLPDGTWIYYSLDPKDSIRKDADNYVSIIGHYKDSLRNGTFRYYTQDSYKKGNRKIETITYNFKNGKLDGYYTSWNNRNEKANEGFYMDGKKDGYFIRYFREWQIETIGLYKNDTLCEWSNYYRNGLIASKGKGEGKFTNGEVIYYDTLGNNNRKEYYQNGKISWYKEFYSNGVLKKMAEGDFDLCYAIADVAEKDKCLNYPLNGNIIYYNDMGKKLKREIYQNNKLKETKNE